MCNKLAAKVGFVVVVVVVLKTKYDTSNSDLEKNNQWIGQKKYLILMDLLKK